MNEPITQAAPTLLISRDFLNDKIAVIEEGKPAEVYVYPRQDIPVLGSIYVGKIQNVIPGLQAVFVDIGRPKNGYLYLKNPENISNYRIGQMVLVQVIKEETNEKGAKLNDCVSLPGKYVVYFPNQNFLKISRKISEEQKTQYLEMISELCSDHYGLIVRTAAQNKPLDEIRQDIESLHSKWLYIAQHMGKENKPVLLYKEDSFLLGWMRDALGMKVDKVIVDDPDLYSIFQDYFEFEVQDLKGSLKFHRKDLFEAYDVYKRISKSLRHKVWLKSGGYLLIDEMDYMTCIDVNSGKYSGKKNLSLLETALEINIEAARQIAEEIRIRNLGGIIVVDFIDMNNKGYEQTVLQTLNEKLSKSLLKSMLLGMNEIGLLHIVRKRKYRSLKGVFSQECPNCDGRGQYYNDDFFLADMKRALLKKSDFRHEFDFEIEISPNFPEEKITRFQEKMKNNYDLNVNFQIDQDLVKFDYVISNAK